jgi:hypothetical protein
MKLNLLLLSAAALANAATSHSVTTTESVIDLGSAEEFVILAKTGISTVPDSSITGDIGVSPVAASYITGFGLVMDSDGEYSTSSQIAGGSGAYAFDYDAPTPSTMTTAVSDMEAAYNEAWQRSSDDDDRTNPGATGEIGGMTLHPGVYTFEGDIQISDDVYFDGNHDDVFIIQTTGNILQAADTKVNLRSGNNGVQASNVFWQVAGHVTVGARSEMQGILLVKTDALFMTGSSLKGRVFAQTAVDLQKASITQPASVA